MEPLDLVEIDELLTHRSNLIRLHCQNREEDPGVASFFSGLIELADFDVLPDITPLKAEPYHFTARCWRGV